MEIQMFKSFTHLENGEVIFFNHSVTECANKLRPGVYNLTYDSDHKSVRLHEITNLEKTLLSNYNHKKSLDHYVDTFVDKKTKEHINAKGFNHTGGVLFYGKEGTGKSTLIRNYCKKYVDSDDALCFYITCEGYYLDKVFQFLKSVRSSHDNVIFVIFEESEKIIESYESKIKSFLDGNLSINHCMSFLTTNYIDKIPDAIMKRKSRVRYAIKVDVITEYEDVYDIVKNMLIDVEDKDCETLAKNLVNSTLDNIKNACFDIIFGIDEIKSEKTIGF